MKIVVNDANILIDLMSIGLFNSFLQLDFEFHTNDFIINEIEDKEQQLIIEEVIASQKLFVNETKSSDYGVINSRKTKNLTFEDCSIWHYTKTVNGILLTGDAKLRKTVEQDGIEVRGILFVFDTLVENNLITKFDACDKLNILRSINSRLPRKEIENRLNLWHIEEQ